MENNPEERTYEQIKELLRNEGWKEQRGGEGYMNGECGTNFMKDGSMLGLSFCDCPDEETLDDLWPESDDLELEKELIMEKNDPGYDGAE